MKNNVVKLKCKKLNVEQLSDIAWCKSIFYLHKKNMSEDFMKPDVVHAYQLANIIRSKALDDDVYNSAMEALGDYGDYLYGSDERVTYWRAKRMVEAYKVNPIKLVELVKEVSK